MICVTCLDRILILLRNLLEEFVHFLTHLTVLMVFDCTNGRIINYTVKSFVKMAVYIPFIIARYNHWRFFLVGLVNYINKYWQ